MTNTVQPYVPGAADTDVIPGGGKSAHSAVVSPGASPLAHFGVVALTGVAMRQVARKNRARTSSPVKTKPPTHPRSLSGTAGSEYVQFN